VPDREVCGNSLQAPGVKAAVSGIAGARRRRGIAHSQLPGNDAAHDCFAHAELADLAIGTATKSSLAPSRC
jgi:hypothetical protein